MEVKIRPARLEDAAALTKLNREEMGYDYPVEKTEIQLEKLLSDKKNGIFVAETAGEVVGYVHLVDYDLLYADHMKNIMGIAVRSDCRRMGIGKMLLTAAEEWARDSGAAGVRLVSGSTRTGAHAFYRSLGYEGNKTQLNLQKRF